MATIQEITQRIATANAEIKRLNNERNINLGKKETLTAQLNNFLAQYEKQYGVKLDINNLASEKDRVLALKENEVKNVETMLALIKEGKFEEAERLANPNATNVVEPTNQLPNLASEVVKPVEPTNPLPNLASEVVKPVEPTNSLPNLANEVVKPVEPTNPLPNLASEVVKPVEPTNPLPNLASELPNLSDELPNLSDELPNLSDELDALKGFTSGEPVSKNDSKVEVKESESTPPNLSGVTDFEAILGGSAFSFN